MKIWQFNRPTPRNVIGAGKRKTGNEFNTGLKRERHPEPPEFYTAGKVKEWKRVSETRDSRPKKAAGTANRVSEMSRRAGNSARRSGSVQRNGSVGKRRGKDSSKRTSRAAQGMIRQAVAILAGAVIVTNTYQSMVAARNLERAAALDPVAGVSDVLDPSSENGGDASQETTPPNAEYNPNEPAAEISETPPPDTAPSYGGDSNANGNTGADSSSETSGSASSYTQQTSEDAQEMNAQENTEAAVTEPTWTWDSETGTASVQIPGYGSVPATVTAEVKPAGCTTPGTRTYTATAEAGGSTYTDTQTETIPATGHSFGETQLTKDADGNDTLSFHCDKCNRDFMIGFDIEMEN
jgi:hypothetical protein